MNKMEKFKEIRTMYWETPAEEPSGTHDGGLGVKEKYDAEVSGAGIVDFILDSFSMREAGFIQENMEKGFKMFVRNNGCKPDYAVCSVAWNDGDIYPEVNIRLSETVNPATDGDIFFYCGGLEGLKSLVFPGAEDFYIADILRFENFTENRQAQNRNTECHPHFLRQI